MTRRRFPQVVLFHNGEDYPFIAGRNGGGPSPAPLNLQPGELVRIKTKDEIRETLTGSPPKNRGMTFDPEMVHYCGRLARVRGRVSRLIDEQTGTMIYIKSDCIVLEGVVCMADFHRFCTRSDFPFWREAWLERAESVPSMDARSPLEGAHRVEARLRPLRHPRAAVHDLEGRRFDKRFRADTDASVSLSQLTVVDGDRLQGHDYVAEPPRVTRWWLQALPSQLDKFTFVDLGSGKGRVVLLAATRNFARLTGVEFAEELHESAVPVFRAMEDSTGRRVASVLGDAGSFEFPVDPLVVHLNNPFQEPVMERVIANLITSYRCRPRPVIVIYQQARVEDNPTRNVELLATAAPFLTHRSLQPSGAINRFLLKPWVIDYFASSEATALS